jgi:RHS repeat-associated protein
LIAELNATNNAVIRSYMWGLDLSGSMQGAGGVGGLLAVNDAANGVHFGAYDGNGNVAALVKGTDGTISAQYEYGSFAEPIRMTGPMGKTNPIRFSTKYTDDESDFLYYGHRYYSPSTGRWPNRDPIGIDGGLNPYAFVGNAPTLFIDPLGLRPLTAAEQAAIAHMRSLQTAIAANPADKKVADKIGSFITDFTAQVAAIPDNQKDPANVAIASTAIVIWDSDSDKFNREAGKEKNTPVSGLTTLKKEINITCNYYVADVIQRATGENLGKKSWSGNVWPPVANDYATPKKDARLKNFSEVQSGGLGDVISFPVPGDSGHVGIYLGYDIYISARTGDGPGTTGKNPVQPFSGVQIKEVPTDERHIIIRHK